ncbi:threonylcarbamoyl-AMP synthase [Candidatus Gottesmanbacteria bacterium]|nr:threonylcarbamoyl-AMP synthase [Candidatus Gottesmanbacteria bacterium]
MVDISKPLNILRSGGIVVFPTDTAYGMGCRIDDENAVKKLFALRRRPETQATPVLVDSIEMAEKYFVSPLLDNVRRLINKYWPGGLTIVYPCKTELVPSLVRAGGQNLGIRMPDHKIVLSLIKKLGAPLLGPSANFHSKPTPYAFEDLDPELSKSVDCVIEGVCKKMLASTVIDCSVTPWKVLREGAVKLVTLSIDTSDNKKIILTLTVRGNRIVVSNKIKSWASQLLLPMIDTALVKHKVSLSDLDLITVKTGEGSYTGIRVGATVAKTLGWLLDIPVD